MVGRSMNHAWYGLFIDLVFVDNQLYKLPNSFVRFQWVSQLLIQMYYITIASPNFFKMEDTAMQPELTSNPSVFVMPRVLRPICG